MLTRHNVFKSQFRSLNYYSLPTSILFVLRKRTNAVALTFSFILLSLFSVL